MRVDEEFVLMDGDFPLSFSIPAKPFLSVILRIDANKYED